jgi:prepilin-type processing-associated H-X9-DG protein
MIAGAISFNSGILCFADSGGSSGHQRPAPRIFAREYGSNLDFAQSIFVVSAGVEWERAPFERCQRALGAIRPGERTVARMRDAVERTLNDDRHQPSDGIPFLVALYSRSEQRLSCFHPIGSALREVVGYDCQGTAAYLGHSLIRNRYDAARSMDELDLTEVFSIAVDALAGIRGCLDGCGESTDMVVLYADGHVSDVNRMPHDSERLRTIALDGLAHAGRAPVKLEASRHSR